MINPQPETPNSKLPTLNSCLLEQAAPEDRAGVGTPPPSKRAMATPARVLLMNHTLYLQRANLRSIGSGDFEGDEDYANIARSDPPGHLHHQPSLKDQLDQSQISDSP